MDWNSDTDKLLEELFLLKQIYIPENSYFDRDKNASLYHIPTGLDLSKLSRDPNQLEFFTHDEVLERLKELTDAYSMEDAASAFVAGLWSAPMIWQCLLPAKLLATQMPNHQHSDYSEASKVCAICGFEQKGVRSTLEFYHRMTSGTPLDGNPVGYVLALEELKNQTGVPEPTDLDFNIFSGVITFIRHLPEGLKYSKVRDMLHKEKLLASKYKYVYQNFLETLALIGVLDTPDYPGLATDFTSYKKRDQRPTVRTDASAPLGWWTSSIGLNEANLTALFPTLELDKLPVEKNSSAKPEETLIGALERKRTPARRSKTPKSPDAGKGEIEAGDIYAVKVRGMGDHVLP